MKQILIWILVAVLLLSGCRTAAAPEANRETQTAKPLPTDSTKPAQSDDVSTVGQLKGRAETRAEAEETASLYGIELVDYQNGLALYATQEDPEEVIRRGEKNGWPQLTLNRTVQLY